MSVTMPRPELLSDSLWQSDDAFADAVVVHDSRAFLADLLDHGNFGVGTFEHPADGMVILRGVGFRLGLDAAVCTPSALDRVRHATVAAVGPVASTRIGQVATVRELMRLIDSVVGEKAGVAAVELSGTFSRVVVSTVATSEPGSAATAAFGRTEGTVAGFRVRPINSEVVRYHLQFLNRDQIFGGRLVDLSITDAQMLLSACAEVHRVVGVRPGPRLP